MPVSSFGVEIMDDEYRKHEQTNKSSWREERRGRAAAKPFAYELLQSLKLPRLEL
jgi:hypothetical protein